MGDRSQRSFTILLNMHEGKTLFRALAELPFKHVYELIGKINSQANKGPAGSLVEKTPFTCTLSGRELDLIVRALGEMPFNAVYPLVENLHAQVRQQTGE